ncbi:MAG: hypothetical protein ACRC46_03165 [Thermoguttaceae bacterium]
MPSIDVYRDWLGITESARPLNHYQLLKVKQFEDNSGLIRKQYREMNAVVRKYASGEFMRESQALLNELAKAMLCLTDAVRKLEYDITLGRKVETARARRSLEEILVGNNIVPADKMGQIKKYANAVGIDLHEAVLQQKAAAPEIVMLAYAESVGLPFVSLEDVGVDEIIAPQIDPNMARQQSFVPILSDQGTLILASPKPVSPDVEENLRMIFEMPVRCALCTTAQVNAAIAKYYPRDAVQVIAQRGKSDASAPTAKKKAASTSSAAARTSSEPVSPEVQKQRLQTVLAAGAFGVMVVSVGGSLTGHAVSLGMMFYPAALLAGAVIAGVTWVVVNR